MNLVQATATLIAEDLLLKRIGDQGQDLLVLVQQKHCAQISQSLVRKARRSQKLETFYLAKMRSFTQRKEIEEFGDIVAAARWVQLLEHRCRKEFVPTVYYGHGSLLESWL